VFINLIELEVTLVAFVCIAFWVFRLLQRGIWR
jgi:hypothetical protein